MADYPNGRIPPEALTALSVGGSLLSGAAASFEAWRAQAAAAGRELTITSVADAYRTFAQQERVFLERYEVIAGNGPYGDVRHYDGRRYVRVRGAAAAVPGTSNHGRGIAIDVANAGAFGGPFHNWLSATGPALGWTNDEGRSVNEPWHWVFGGDTSTPTPPTEEDMPLTDTDIAKIWGVKPTGTSTFGEMLMHVKMRLSNGTAPQAAGLSEVAALRKEMLAGFADIKKAIGS